MANTLTHAALHNNPVWVQLLGLCPLLAVSNSVTHALGLAFASLFVVVGSNTLISLLRHWIHPYIRLPMFVLVIATFTTLASMLLEAFAFDLYLKVALFVQIIVTNCMILGRAEAFASRHSVGRTLLDATGTGLGFGAALLLLGAVREVLGRGTLLAGSHTLFGPAATDWTITLLPVPPLPLASLAPGAFIVAGLLLAAANSLTGLRTDEQTNTHTNL